VRLARESFALVDAALMDAFANTSELGDVARSVDRRTSQEIAPGLSMQKYVVALIEWSEAHDQVADLIEAAQKQNSTNALLSALDATQLHASDWERLSPKERRLPPQQSDDRPARSYRLAENRLSGRSVCTAVWNHAGTTYAVGTEDSVELYNVSGSFQRQFAAPSACYLSGGKVQWSPADDMLAILTDHGALEVIDVATGERRPAGASLERPWQISWSHDGSMIAVSGGGLSLVRVADGIPLLVSSEGYFGVGMSPVEDIFVAGRMGPGEAPLFEVRTTSDGELTAEVGRVSETGSASLLAFDPSGQRIAAAFEGFGLEIWELATRSRLATLTAPYGAITDLRWSPDGQQLMATTHTPQVVRVYDAMSFDLLGELGRTSSDPRQHFGVNAASIGPDGVVMVVQQGPSGIDVYELQANAGP
jgi:WD40 repeat protein